MPELEPIGVVTYPWWVLALGIAAIVLVIAWLLFLWKPWRKRSTTAKKSKETWTPEIRRTFATRLEELVRSFMRDEINVREFHLQLAVLVREFGSANTGRDLTPMSREEVERAFPRTGLGPLLARAEQPSFAKDTRAEVETSAKMAREVFGR